jgi:Flp pilus assembly pilin Flp
MTRLWRDQSGVAAVEAAIVLPVLLLTLLGGLQVSAWMMQKQSTQATARHQQSKIRSRKTWWLFCEDLLEAAMTSRMDGHNGLCFARWKPS